MRRTMRSALEGIFGAVPKTRGLKNAYGNAIVHVMREIEEQKEKIPAGPCRAPLENASLYLRKAEQLIHADPEASFRYYSWAVGDLREAIICKYMTVTRDFPMVWMKEFRRR